MHVTLLFLSLHGPLRTMHSYLGFIFPSASVTIYSNLYASPLKYLTGLIIAVWCIAAAHSLKFLINRCHSFASLLNKFIIKQSFMSPEWKVGIVFAGEFGVTSVTNAYVFPHIWSMWSVTCCDLTAAQSFFDIWRGLNWPVQQLMEESKAMGSEYWAYKKKVPYKIIQYIWWSNA